MADELNFIDYKPEIVLDKLLRALMEGADEALYPGDERRIFTETLGALIVQLYAAANDAAKQKTLRYARGALLDALGERVSVERIPARPAFTTLRFTLSAPRRNAVVIPAGTKATSDGKLYFQTITAGIIQTGNISTDIPAESTGGGETFNGLPVNTISTIVDLIPYVESVSNTEITHGGNDAEDDEHYRERIRQAPTKYSTAGPVEDYKYWAKSANMDIIEAEVYTPQPGCVTIAPVIADGAGASMDVLDNIYRVCNDKTIRPLTDFLVVRNPEFVEYDISFKCYMRAEDEAIAVSNIEGNNGTIEKYIKWQSAKIVRNVNPDQIRREVLCPNWALYPIGALRIDVI
ncbi:MAG: baseplate J/gp47 family protein [Oscillospiraceae bacterium]|jgi:phage-related baseplate assembly protein|nr:baseplate J/gp47 family protein [Oscillospiraceae bacterium]